MTSGRARLPDLGRSAAARSRSALPAPQVDALIAAPLGVALDGGENRGTTIESFSHRAAGAAREDTGS